MLARSSHDAGMVGVVGLLGADTVGNDALIMVVDSFGRRGMSCLFLIIRVRLMSVRDQEKRLTILRC